MPGFSKTTPAYLKIPKDAHKTLEVFQSLPKTRLFNLHTIDETETVPTFPSPRLRTCIAKQDLAPSALYLKKEVSSLAHSFFFLHWFEFTYFWRLCQEKLQPLTFFNQAREFGS